MQNRLPTVRPVLPFTPVPRKYRVDGWTDERQRAFIAALAETGSVKSAAHRINMSPEGAYHLRRQPGAESFRIAWDAAIDHGVQSLRDLAMERARDGVAQPIVAKGEVIGEKRVYDNRLLTFLIRRHDQLDGLAPGTKSDARLEQEARDRAAQDDPSIKDEIVARLFAKFREAAQNTYDNATDAEIAANVDAMSIAEFMALQMYRRPPPGERLPQMPDGDIPPALRQRLGG